MSAPAASHLADLHAYVDQHGETFVQELCEFVRQASQTGHLDQVREGAHYAAALAERSGWQVEVIEVGELAPLVLAECPGPPGSKTLLMYSHYDVISPEPIDQWTYPPYSATREDGRIYGRGSTDSKANIMSFLKAVQSYKATRGQPPLSLKLILEGEEERGSGNLHEFMDRFEHRLQADSALSFDGGIDASGVPKIGLGTSGMLYVELVAKGARKELHSAQARLYMNPAWRLVWALASIKGPDERVLIDGFYDGIQPPTDEDRRLMAAMPWDDQRLLNDAGLESFLTGVRGQAAIERVLFQPGLAICGMISGFTGEGPKAVIPNRASAKLEFRIVPDQTPERTLELLRTHLQTHGFGDIEIEVISVVETAKTDPDADIVRAVIAAAKELYGGREPMLKPTEEYAGLQGAWLGSRLGIPGVQTGVGPVGFRGHAVDEFCTDEALVRGIKYAAGIFDHYARS